MLIEVAGLIDTLPTIGFVMLTAIVGVMLLKRQGLATLTRGTTRLNQGEVPALEMAEGILLAVAGALLITPGFITDSIGFVLLFPPTRVYVARRLINRVHLSGVHVQGEYRSGPEANGSQGPVTLEGDFERRD